MELSYSRAHQLTKAHVHVIVGPYEEVNIYSMPGFGYRGPLFETITDDPMEAVEIWATLVNEWSRVTISPEEMDEVFEYIFDAFNDIECGLEVEDKPFVFVDEDMDAPTIVGVAVCDGCVPKCMN